MKNPVSLQQENQNLRSLIQTSLLLNSPLELARLLDLITKICKKVMKAEAATLMLVDEKEGDLFYEVALGEKGKLIKKRFRLKMGQGVAGWVAQQAKPVILADASKDPRFYAAVDKASGFRSKSMICVPLLVEGNVIGVLQAINPTHKKGFDESDLEIFQVFSAQVAVAVAKARWHEKMLHEQKLQQDLGIAREIQKNFLCKEAIHFQKMRFYAKYEPAQTVGGDFYDCFSLGLNKAAVMLGDVSGKGIPAALYMVRTVTEFRDLVPDLFPDIGTVVSMLNESLAEKSTFGMFVTAAVVGLDLAKESFYVVNAGHLPPAIYRRSTGKAQWLARAEQPPLGLLPGTSYAATCHKWEKGDRLLLFSDGLVEERDRKGKEFGADRLLKLFEAAARGPKESGILPRLFDTIKRFGAAAARDDQTAVLVCFS